MDSEWVFGSATEERLRIADLAAGLDEAQLATPSLCSGWDVKTVVAHLVTTLTHSTSAFLLMALRRGSMDAGINELTIRTAQAPSSEVVASLRRLAGCRKSPPGVGPLDPLADVLVHSGDIWIPLGLPFEPDRERAAAALDFLTGPWRFAFVPRSLLKGICLRATDHDRAWGRGAEIIGPVAALMMAAGGRTALLDALEGPGLAMLQDRLS